MLRRSMRVPAEALSNPKGFDKRVSRFFTLRSRPNGLLHDRFAVIVSARTARLATERHRLKRRLAAYLHSRTPDGTAHAGRDIIVSILPPARDLRREALLAELDKLL